MIADHLYQEAFTASFFVAVLQKKVWGDGKETAVLMRGCDGIHTEVSSSARRVRS